MQRDVLLVGFKAETNVSKESLVKQARKKIRESGADLIIANDVGIKKYKENPDYNNVVVVDSKKIIESGWKNKTKIAKFIRNEIEKRIS